MDVATYYLMTVGLRELLGDLLELAV